MFERENMIYSQEVELTEYYAGQVLNGIFANNFEYNSLELIAEIAFKSAQAMIKEGEKYK